MACFTNTRAKAQPYSLICHIDNLLFFCFSSLQYHQTSLYEQHSKQTFEASAKNCRVSKRTTCSYVFAVQTCMRILSLYKALVFCSGLLARNQWGECMRNAIINCCGLRSGLRVSRSLHDQWNKQNHRHSGILNPACWEWNPALSEVAAVNHVDTPFLVPKSITLCKVIEIHPSLVLHWHIGLTYFLVNGRFDWL